MSLLQNLYYISQRMPFGSEQHQVMIHQVGSFVQEKLLVVVFRFDNELNGFFAYLLRNFI